MMGLLGWIGRQRAHAVAALVLFGLLLPPLGEILKPYVTHAVIGLLCVAFLRIDIMAFLTYLRRPGIVAAALFWNAVALPLLFAAAAAVASVQAFNPDLYTGLMLQAAAPPIMAAPSFAALVGLDATLVLIAMLTSTLLLPLAAPIFVSWVGLDLSLSPADLSIKLLAILAGSAFVGLTLRHLLGTARIARCRDQIDGLNIVLLSIFISAMMGPAGMMFLAAPLVMLGLTLLAFLVFFLLLIASLLAFWRMGKAKALALAVMSAQRNMGLMLAATGGVLPDQTWLYFAVGQFPIYLSPLMIQPLARRMLQRARR